MRFSIFGRRSVAALVCVLALAAAAFFWWSRRDASPREMASFVPNEDGVLAYVDVRALRNSGVLDPRSQGAQEEADYKRFVSQTGFDYRRDLDAVLISLQGEKTYAVAKGRFGFQSLSEYALTHGGRCRDRYCSAASPTQGRIVSFHPLRTNLLAFASAGDEWAASAIGAGHGSKEVEIPVQPVWISISPYYLKNHDQYPSGMRLFAKILSHANRVLLTLGPEGNRFALSLKAGYASASDAEIARKQLQEITATLRNLITRERQAPNANDLSGVLTSGVFRTAGATVQGDWPIERGFLEGLAGGTTAK